MSGGAGLLRVAYGPPSVSPRAVPGNYEVTAGTLSAFASAIGTAANGALTCAWRIDGGSEATVPCASPTLSLPVAAGPHLLTFAVTDAYGLRGELVMQIAAP
jgi:hypothetical protein